MNYRISIIIPVYHVEDFIERCLLSVSKQTLTWGIECIIVDDCGGDHSIDIAEQFVNEYNGDIKFIIYHRSENGGLSAARNSGIRIAQGDYIYFLDSDDEITPNCMELLYSKVEKYGDVDLVQGMMFENIEEMGGFSRYDFPEYTNNKSEIKSFLLKYAGDIIPAQTKLIKNDLIRENNLYFKEGIIHEDNYWTFFLAKHVTSMCFCKEHTYYHRYNPNSITGKINRDKEIEAYNVIINDLVHAIDPFLDGVQKIYILNNLITAINAKFYNKEIDKQLLINNFYNSCNRIERLISKFYFSVNNPIIKSKTLHLLIRIINLNS